MDKFGWASPETVGKLTMPQLNWLINMVDWQAKEEEKAHKKAKMKSRRR